MNCKALRWTLDLGYAKLLISGKPLHVYGLHLKSNLGNPVENTSKREDAMKQLVEHTKAYSKPGEGVVVVGDFNTSKEQVNLLVMPR